MSYEDAMAALDDELGEDDTADLLAPRPAQPQKTASAGSTGEPGSSRGGVAVSAELANWIRETQRRIQSQWVTPASLRGRGLATTLELRLSPTGDVLGEPRDDLESQVGSERRRLLARERHQRLERLERWTVGGVVQRGSELGSHTIRA